MIINKEINIGICPIQVTIHDPVPGQKNNTAILYFHGGGLFYGSRNDLPIPYIKVLLNAGFTLYCFDYPLAPEATLEQISLGVTKAWQWFTEEEIPGQGIVHYFLFGRSAGEYLTLLLAKNIGSSIDKAKPTGILAYYGFYDIEQPFFSEPNPHYAKLPSVSRGTALKITSGHILTNGSKEQRFSLYVYTRQQGAWLQMLGIEPEKTGCFSLSDEDVAALPPLFITASTGDKDIPFGESKRLAKTASQAVIKPVYYLEHDFDRDTTNPVGLEVYQEAIAWMNRLIRSHTS